MSIRINSDIRAKAGVKPVTQGCPQNSVEIPWKHFLCYYKMCKKLFFFLKSDLPIVHFSLKSVGHFEWSPNCSFNLLNFHFFCFFFVSLFQPLFSVNFVTTVKRNYFWRANSDINIFMIFSCGPEDRSGTHRLKLYCFKKQTFYDFFTGVIMGLATG